MDAKHFVFSSLICVLCLSCSGGGSDEPYVDPTPPPAPQPIALTTPNWLGGSLVTQIKYAGAFDKVWQWRFGWQNGQMTTATSWRLTDGLTQTRDNEAARYEFNFGVSNITVQTSGIATPVSYELKDRLLVSAHSGNTTYSYAYSGDGRLMSWEVNYQNTGFGAESTKGAAGIVTWTSDGDIAEIIYTPSVDAPTRRYTYTYTYSEALNMNGLMPELSSRALGCEGSEYMYYMGMLGKSTRHLPSHLNITFSETPESPDSYSFIYSPTTGADVRSLQYGTYGNVVVVEYNY